MTNTVHSATLLGHEVVPIRIEVELLDRLSRMVIVGLPEAHVRETAERVRSAIVSQGFEFPRKRVIINILPSDARISDPTSLDLPIALGILVASGQVSDVGPFLPYGELSLAGTIRQCRGSVAVALLATPHERTLIISRDTYGPLSVPGAWVLRCPDLRSAVEAIDTGTTPETGVLAQRSLPDTVDLAEVRGNPEGRRLLEAVATTGLPLLLIGEPGCGASMLAHRLPTILPPMTEAGQLQIMAIRDAAGLGSDVSGPPFRAPHHTITVAGMAGDRRGRLGELTLAHGGVLFLDGIHEFPVHVLDVVYQAFNAGRVMHTRFPARFHLVASTTEEGLADLEKRRPGLARAFVLRARLQRISDLRGFPEGESSADVRARVMERASILRAKNEPGSTP